MTPFLGGYFKVVEEPQYGLRSPVFLSSAEICHVGCKLCPYRNRKKPLMNEEKFIKEFYRFELMGAEMFTFRGGELSNYVSEVQPTLEMISTKVPIRIHTNGLKLQSLKRLIPLVSGFCLDIKIPLRSSYNQSDRSRYLEWVPSIKCFTGYRDAILSTIESIDSMQFTYYTSSTYVYWTEVEKQELKDYMRSCKAPFIGRK